MPTGNPQILPILEGGTGAKTAAAARTNLGIGTAALYGVWVGNNTISYSSISANSEQTQTLTVTDADPTIDAAGVSLNWDDALENGIVVKQAWISALNTVSIRLANVTGSPITPATRTVSALILYYQP